MDLPAHQHATSTSDVFGLGSPVQRKLVKRLTKLCHTTTPRNGRVPCPYLNSQKSTLTRSRIYKIATQSSLILTKIDYASSVPNQHLSHCYQTQPVSFINVVRKYLKTSPNQRRKFTSDEINLQITLDTDLTQECLKNLTGDQISWATAALPSLSDAGNLSIKTVVETNFETTILLRRSAPKIGQTCSESTIFSTPSLKCYRKIGRSQQIRLQIHFIFSCFDAMKMKNGLLNFSLLNLFNQEGAEHLTEFKYGPGTLAHNSARDRILKFIDASYYRDDIAEYLLFHKMFLPGQVYLFIIKGILFEKQSKRRKSLTSLDCNPYSMFMARALDHANLSSRDISDLFQRRGLTSRVIIQFASYLDQLSSSIKILHPHCYSNGDHRHSGHAPYAWIHSTYLKDLDTSPTAFIFLVLQSDSSDTQGAHMYALIARKENKRIFSIDINLTDHSNEIEFLCGTMDHYVSCQNRRNPWNKETETFKFPEPGSTRTYICSDYILMCLEYFVRTESTEFPTSFTEDDYDDFRQRLYTLLATT